jgi:CheY-like chemotaxis protein
MYGFTATRHIRATPGMETLPIIAMTANVLDTDRLACLEAGMNDHLGKPFNIDVLVTTILHWTKGREHAADASAPVASPPAPTSKWVDADLDYAGSLARFGGREAPYHAALRSFERSAQESIVGLEVALENNDTREAAMSLHALKGMAATIGANRLSAMAGSYEREALEGSIQAGESAAVAHLTELTASVAAVIRKVLGASAPAPAPAVDVPLDRDALTELAKLLAASNMSAVDHYEEMRGQLAIAHPDLREQLENAMSMLDLKAGLRICNELIEATNKERPHD